ncbi:MAG: PLP-dependent aminotransferase family protein [Devosia nanyangense]|nr:PLP-dependent aminotransferase family protein [Devosia nanyangense]
MVLEKIAKRVPMRSSRSLSRTVMEMVSDGDLPSGTKMPTVRAVAKALGMSAASVAVAWRELVDWRVFETNRRGGTVVLGPPLAPRATRFDVMMRASEGIPFNLGHLTPDRAILPPMGPALLAVSQSAELNDQAPTPISTALRRAIEPIWPFTPNYLLAAHGGIAALEMALATSVRPGDRVIIETPTVSRILDILESIGARPVPIDYREDGPDLQQLAQALKTRPAAFVYQPIGNHPTGFSISQNWSTEAAKLLRDVRIPIIELVQTVLMHKQPWLSLGSHLPHAVVHIQSYNFFFGSDLRVGIAGGSDYYIDRMWQQLTFSSRWVSRVLQDALAFQLTDAEAQRHLERFIATCRQRRNAFVSALRNVGFVLPETDAPPIWLPVSDEYIATNQMSARGVVVHPGSYFSPEPLASDHVLLNGTILAEGFEDMAQQLSRAADTRGLRGPMG